MQSDGLTLNNLQENLTVCLKETCITILLIWWSVLCYKICIQHDKENIQLVIYTQCFSPYSYVLFLNHYILWTLNFLPVDVYIKKESINEMPGEPYSSSRRGLTYYVNFLQRLPLSTLKCSRSFPVFFLSKVEADSIWNLFFNDYDNRRVEWEIENTQLVNGISDCSHGFTSNFIISPLYFFKKKP